LDEVDGLLDDDGLEGVDDAGLEEVDDAGLEGVEASVVFVMECPWKALKRPFPPNLP
jgi:hypothetical protein